MEPLAASKGEEEQGKGGSVRLQQRLPTFAPPPSSLSHPEPFTTGVTGGWRPRHQRPAAGGRGESSSDIDESSSTNRPQLPSIGAMSSRHASSATSPMRRHGGAEEPAGRERGCGRGRPEEPAGRWRLRPEIPAWQGRRCRDRPTAATCARRCARARRRAG
jgi:hypothetical protein